MIKTDNGMKHVCSKFQRKQILIYMLIQYFFAFSIIENNSKGKIFGKLDKIEKK